MIVGFFERKEGLYPPPVVFRVLLNEVDLFMPLGDIKNVVLLF